MTDLAADNRVSLRLALRPLAHAFDFSGRATRTEVGSFWLLAWVANLVSGIISAAAIFPGESRLPAEPSVLGGLWILLWLWPLLPLLIRRLHDQGRGAGWAASAVVTAVVDLWSALLGTGQPGDHFSGYTISATWFGIRWIPWTPLTTTLMLVGTAGALICLVLYLMPGQPGANRYGPDPRL